MPVVHLRALAVDQALVEGLPAIAQAVALAVPCAPEAVWCTLARLEGQSIGGDRVGGEGRIVYVDVWLRERDDPAAAGRALEAACRATAAAAGIPVVDVWGALHPVVAGRVFAGGALVG